MDFTIGAAAPTLAADAVVAGEPRRCIDLAEYRGSWVVVAFAARAADLRELAALEEAFAADGAIVLATTPDDYHDAERAAVEHGLRFPLFTDVEETRRVTMIVDPGGVIRHVGLRRDARETLTALEWLLVHGSLRLVA